MAQKLDEELQQWRSRALGEMEYLFLDARYEHVRTGGTVVSLALSGGIWRDGDLHATGHDNPVLFQLRLPKQGAVLELVGKRTVPFTGQGIAHDPKTRGLVGINRAKRQVVFASLQNAGP